MEFVVFGKNFLSSLYAKIIPLITKSGKSFINNMKKEAPKHFLQEHLNLP